MVSIGRMKNEAFEVELAYAAKFGTWLEGHIKIVANAICPFEKTDFGVEIRTNLSMLGEHFEPVGLVIESCTEIRLSGGEAWCSRLGSITIHDQILVEDQPGVCTAGLVETVERIS